MIFNLTITVLFFLAMWWLMSYWRNWAIRRERRQRANRQGQLPNDTFDDQKASESPNTPEHFSRVLTQPHLDSSIPGNRDSSTRHQQSAGSDSNPVSPSPTTELSKAAAPPMPATITATSSGDTATSSGDTATSSGDTATTSSDTATTPGDNTLYGNTADSPVDTATSHTHHEPALQSSQVSPARQALRRAQISESIRLVDAELQPTTHQQHDLAEFGFAGDSAAEQRDPYRLEGEQLNGEQLTSRLSAREQQIAALQKKFDQQTAAHAEDVKRWQDQLHGKERRAQHLLKDSGQIAELQMLLNTRTQTLAETREELTATKKAHEHLAMRESELAQLQQQADRFSTLESTLRQRDQSISDLHAELEQSVSGAKAAEERFLAALQIAERQREVSENALREAIHSSQAETLRMDTQRPQGEQLKVMQQALDTAEADKVAALANNVELRRLQSEVHGLRQQKVVDDGEIARLATRISDYQAGSSSSSPVPSAEQAGDAREAAHSSGATATSSRSSREPLFKAPDERDDLKKIKGIGKVMERTLNELGVTTFKQLAGLDTQDVQRVSDALDVFPGRIDRDKWVQQARDIVARHSPEKA